MFWKTSISVAIAGFTGFVAVFGLVLYHKPDPHELMWPMLISTEMMALGMIGIAISVHRSSRAQIARE